MLVRCDAPIIWCVALCRVLLAPYVQATGHGSFTSISLTTQAHYYCIPVPKKETKQEAKQETRDAAACQNRLTHACLDGRTLDTHKHRGAFKSSTNSKRDLHICISLSLARPQRTHSDPLIRSTANTCSLLQGYKQIDRLINNTRAKANRIKHTSCNAVHAGSSTHYWWCQSTCHACLHRTRTE